MRISDWSSDVCSSDLEVGRMVADIREQSEAVVSYIQRQSNELDAAAEQIATTGEQLSGIAELAGSVESQVEQITTGTADNHQRLTGQFVALDQLQIGRASCRERVCQSV